MLFFTRGERVKSTTIEVRGFVTNRPGVAGVLVGQTLFNSEWRFSMACERRIARPVPSLSRSPERALLLSVVTPRCPLRPWRARLLERCALICWTWPESLRLAFVFQRLHVSGRVLSIPPGPPSFRVPGCLRAESVPPWVAAQSSRLGGSRVAC